MAHPDQTAKRLRFVSKGDRVPHIQWYIDLGLVYWYITNKGNGCSGYVYSTYIYTHVHTYVFWNSFARDVPIRILANLMYPSSKSEKNIMTIYIYICTMYIYIHTYIHISILSFELRSNQLGSKHHSSCILPSKYICSIHCPTLQGAINRSVVRTWDKKDVSDVCPILGLYCIYTRVICISDIY
jgi:hypothetical protein